jgi:hypothetical protein
MPMAKGRMAERMGIEPTKRVSPFNGLANPSESPVYTAGISIKARPSHLSKARWERMKRRHAYLAKARESAQYDPRSGKPHKSLEEVLSRYRVMPNGCHEWTGSLNTHGYGLVCLMLDGKPNTMPAHRLQWMRVKGKIPDGLDACHTCDNRRCINEDHLFLGTPKDNIHDMIRKGRANFQGLKQNRPLGTESGTPHHPTAGERE